MDNGMLTWFLNSVWFAIAAGTLLQVLGTQKVKFWLPAHLSDNVRRRVIRLIGGFLGFVPTYLIMRGQSCPAYQMFWVAILVSMAGPMIYAAASVFIYRRWPELEGTLSAHEHARRRRFDASIGQDSKSAAPVPPKPDGVK